MGALRTSAVRSSIQVSGQTRISKGNHLVNCRGWPPELVKESDAGRQLADVKRDMRLNRGRPGREAPDPVPSAAPEALSVLHGAAGWHRREVQLAGPAGEAGMDGVGLPSPGRPVGATQAGATAYHIGRWIDV